MTTEKLRSYRFSTEAQWDACLFLQADRSSPGTQVGLHPFAPYDQSAQRYEAIGAHAPATTRMGEVVWIDARGQLYRLPAGDNLPQSAPAPFAIAQASRLVTTSSGFWVASNRPESLHCYEAETLTRLFVVEIPDGHVVDIASDWQASVQALVRYGDEENAEWRSVSFDCAGRIVSSARLEGLSGAKAFVFLPRSRQLVVLADEPQQRLYWFSAEGGTALFSIATGFMHPCFAATLLGSDPLGRVFVAGTDGEEFGGASHVLILDSDGIRLGEIALDVPDAPATGIAATRDSLIVTGQRGMLRFSVVDRVPDQVGDVSCLLVTPSLYSPDREDMRRWLRIEALARLPAGSTLEISIAATDDPAIRHRLDDIAADTALTSSQRVQQLKGEPDIWQPPIIFYGADTATGDTNSPVSAPLFDVRERYLWVCVKLSGAIGARLPALSELAVLYPGCTLMEYLPSIYQRAEVQRGSFLRALVGVLETTTQGLDARIATMGSLLHPTTAPPLWLNYIARWLGLPWDDALEIEQKRSIVIRAAEITEWRGTRAGIEALLQCLMPGESRRFRVTDLTADFGFAIVGDDVCRGSTLPALLGGLTPWSAELGSRTVLGCMRLPCESTKDDGTARLAGRIIIEVAASAKERRAWEPWLLALITEMIPLTARVELRWVSAHALRGNTLDGTLTLESVPRPHLGTDAITGLTRLPERRQSLSATGPDIGGLLH